MAENRWQIAVGALVLLGMLLAATFSLGVYVGRHGLSREGLRYQPGPQAGQPQVPGGPGGAPGPRPDLIGRLRGASPQGLELATQQGPRFVALNEDTKLESMQGDPLTVEDLKPGDLLAVFGEFSVGDGRELLATRVVRLPERPPDRP